VYVIAGLVMLRRLNSAQRLWALGSALFLATTIAVIAAAWPVRDPAIVADLRRSECQAGLDLPVRQGATDTCQSLRALMYEEHVTLGSPADYDTYLWRARARIALACVATWAFITLGFYLLAWSSARFVRALGRLRREGG
jgi:hypothetical protein